MSDSDENIVELYRARSLPEAHAIRLMLEQEGIVVSIANEILQGIIGETAMGWSTSPRMMVRQQDADRARKLLESFAGQTTHLHSPARDDTLRCLACGIVMEDEDACSACGWSYESNRLEAAIPVAPALPASDFASELEEIVPQSQIKTCDDILPTLSDTPVLPTKIVFLEMAVVLSFGFLTHFTDSLRSSVINHQEPYWSEMVHFMIHGSAEILMTLYVMSCSGERWSEFGITRLRATDILLGFIVTLIIWYFGAVIYVIVSRWAAPSTQTYSIPVGAIDYCLMMIAVPIAAFAEEIVMRSYLITRLRQLTHKPWLAVVISSVLFALYHGYQGLPGLANALFIGLIFGGLFMIYPRIWPVAIGHTAYNLLIHLSSTA